MLFRRASRKAQAYRQAFSSEAGKRVLADLAAFCRARGTTFHPDPQQQSFRAGRQDVWHRINGFINLDDATISKMKELDLDDW